MSYHQNIIDLTAESDDEIKQRLHGGARLTPKQSPNPLHSLTASILQRDYQDDFGRWQYSNESLRSSNYRLNPSRTLHHDLDRQDSSPLPRSYYEASQNYDGSKYMTEAPDVALKTRRLTASLKSQVRQKACVNCAEVNVTCDGERPCSACVEPGLVCYYPGENPMSHMDRRAVLEPPTSKMLSEISSRVKCHPTHSAAAVVPQSSTSALSGDDTKQSDLLPNPVLRHVHEIQFLREEERHACEGPFWDSEDSDDDEVPLAITDVDEVKRLLTRHEVRMRDHRAYVLQPLLNQSRLDASNNGGPYLSGKSSNPFASLVKKTKAVQASTLHKSSMLHLQLRSGKSGATKKWTQISIDLKIIDTDPNILPKYKSIGRLGASLLAPNIRTLKYWPYFADEESLDPSEAKKNEELEERYQHDDNRLLAQRKCSELVEMWHPWVKDFVSKLGIEFRDIFYWFLHTPGRADCDTCEREFQAEGFNGVSQLLSKPTERSLRLAQLSTVALRQVAKISMWHFVINAPSVQDLLAQVRCRRNDAVTICSICFVHNCLSHGAFQEPEESTVMGIMAGNIEINDEEPNFNLRVSVTIPNHDYAEEHQCGLFCIAAEARLKDILGQKRDGTFGGICNHSIHVSRPGMRNGIRCSEACFWLAEKRSKFGTIAQTRGFQPRMSALSVRLFRQLLRTYADNQRAPCMIAREIEDLSCMDAFYYMLAETQRVSHYRHVLANTAQNGTRKLSKVTTGLDLTLSADLDERPPFIPCSHCGPCFNNPDCTCVRNKIHCEWSCGCDKACDRRFPGCRCASASRTCFSDKTCECWKHNRECDPWVCGTCGVVEVLDPRNKYAKTIRRGRCKNNRIQLELPARTIKAPSEVQGWGLYAGTDLEENVFIGEYKGETVGNQESDRRGAVYANIGQEYLFVMNRDQQIDGSNFGNKTRFINNSQRDDYINVFAKKLLCNGVQRVMLYSKRPIMAGEELLYNYNYPIAVTKKFWERGEGPTNVPGAVVAKPSISWTQPRVNGRFAKVAVKQDGEQPPTIRGAGDGATVESNDDPVSNREMKRKRLTAGNATYAHATATPTSKIVSVPFPDDPNDSDFELVDPTESSESVEEVEGESDPGDALEANRRRRIVHPHDRRRGGLAQAKAWETRRRRTGKGK